MNKLFNIFKKNKVEGIIFRGFIFGAVSALKFVEYAQSKYKIDLFFGIVVAVLALFTIDDYFEYKKEKHKLLNEK
jgi:UDP-N-acetylmuramyl pentapeptide phosphotransferase/UDP-N-acetylglucosamine-1-phosphate transferase